MLKNLFFLQDLKWHVIFGMVFTKKKSNILVQAVELT